MENNLNSQINQLATSIAENEKIAKILAYDTPNMYKETIVPSTEFLIDNRIHKFGYIPNIENEIGTYLTIRPNNFGITRKGGYYTLVDVLINIFTHDNLQVTNYGNRLLLLSDELRREINGKRIAIGELKLDRGGIIPTLRQPYSGYWFSCQIVDFNSR